MAIDVDFRTFQGVCSRREGQCAIVYCNIGFVQSLERLGIYNLVFPGLGSPWSQPEYRNVLQMFWNSD